MPPNSFLSSVSPGSMLHQDDQKAFRLQMPVPNVPRFPCPLQGTLQGQGAGSFFFAWFCLPRISPGKAGSTQRPAVTHLFYLFNNLSARYSHAEHFTEFTHFILIGTAKIDTIITPFTEEDLRHREVKEFSQSHTASKPGFEPRQFNSSIQAPDHRALPHLLPSFLCSSKKKMSLPFKD